MWADSPECHGDRHHVISAFGMLVTTNGGNRVHTLNWRKWGKDRKQTHAHTHTHTYVYTHTHLCAHTHTYVRMCTNRHPTPVISHSLLNLLFPLPPSLPPSLHPYSSLSLHLPSSLSHLLPISLPSISLSIRLYPFLPSHTPQTQPSSSPSHLTFSQEYIHCRIINYKRTTNLIQYNHLKWLQTNSFNNSSTYILHCLLLIQSHSTD